MLASIPFWLSDHVMKTVLFVANTAWNLVNFRSPIIDALIGRGDRVIAAGFADRSQRALEEKGVVFHPLDIASKSVNPGSDLNLLSNLRSLYARTKADIALHFTIKPVIYGSLAARSRQIPAINTITGLGTAFIRRNWITTVVENLYRFALSGNSVMVFQNSDDLSEFQDRRLFRRNPYYTIPGSGVDLDSFPQKALPARERTRFLLVARLLKDKGVMEFIDAASGIKKQYPNAQFALAGPADVANRTAIPMPAVQGWEKEGIIEYLGELPDIRPAITAADCIVLPSYREGLSRVLLEASAIGRPMITTDVPGCRDVVEDGVNGFLCRPRDAQDLANQMGKFLNADHECRFEMANNARKKAENEFDVRLVVQKYLALIDEYTSN